MQPIEWEKEKKNPIERIKINDSNNKSNINPNNNNKMPFNFSPFCK